MNDRQAIRWGLAVGTALLLLGAAVQAQTWTTQTSPTTQDLNDVLEHRLWLGGGVGVVEAATQPRVVT